nr:type II toxin-antitoxin system RelE/ParE family toxin [Duganella sp. 1411]
MKGRPAASRHLSTSPPSNSECWPPVAEYRLTPAAERDLESIWIYTSQRWSIDQADRYIDMLTATRTAPRPPCRRCA